MTSSAPFAASSRCRALVVEPDQELRQRVTKVLRESGMEVMDCADVMEGRALFADHRLVLAPLNGDNTSMKEFVAWVRAEAGVSQPWIIAMGIQHELAPGETPAHYGVNDLLTGPVDTGALVKRLEELGLGRSARGAANSNGNSPGTRPAGSPPSYHRARHQAQTVSSWDAASAPVLLEQFPAAVAILDKHMKYLAVNSRWVREFQIPATSLTGRCHYDIFPDLHQDWRGLYEGCLAGDKKQSIDDAMLRPDGTEHQVHWEIQPWHDSAQAVGGLVLTCASVNPALSIPAVLTEKELEEEVPAQAPAAAAVAIAPQKPDADDSFREMAEAAPFGMILLDDESHVLYANPQHRSVLGFAAEKNEPIQTWLVRACAGDDIFQKRALDEWWESVWRRRTSLTCSLRNAEGLLKEIEFRPAALSGDRLLLTVFDVTDARLDEQAVRTSEARYRGLFQQASAALVMINPAGNITEVNPAFETLTGLPRNEARRAALSDFLTPEVITKLRSATLTGGHAGGFHATLRHRSGTESAVHLSVAVIRNEQGQPAFTACLLAPLPPSPAATHWEQITPDWLFLLDADGTILEHTTPRDFAFWQKPGVSLKGEALETALTDLTAPLPLDVMMERLLDSPGHETRCEYAVTLPDEATPRRVEARLMMLASGPPHRFGLTLRDVTRARSATSPGGFSVALLENLRTPALLTNEKGRILHVNPAAEALSGYATAELKEGGLYRLFRPDSPKEFSEELSSHLRTQRCWHAPACLTSKQGLITHGHVELTPAFDEASGSKGFILLFRAGAGTAPAPDTNRPAISLHRARNDIQVLTSLMALQADQTGDNTARQALVAGRDRLAAVGLIYRLVQHEEDAVDFARFALELGRNLLEAHRRPPGAITIDPLFSGIALPQRTAISLGLILEELLTASLAWSFPAPEATGHIRLTLTTGGGEGVLIVRDNGRPLSEPQRQERETTFSHQLVKLLADQIGGSLTYLSDLENQVRLRFRFPD